MFPAKFRGNLFFCQSRLSRRLAVFCGFPEHFRSSWRITGRFLLPVSTLVGDWQYSVGFREHFRASWRITSRFFPKAFLIGKIFVSYFAIKYILRLCTKCPFSIFEFLSWFENIHKRLKFHEKIRARYCAFRMPPLSKQH